MGGNLPPVINIPRFRLFKTIILQTVAESSNGIKRYSFVVSQRKFFVLVNGSPVIRNNGESLCSKNQPRSQAANFDTFALKYPRTSLFNYKIAVFRNFEFNFHRKFIGAFLPVQLFKVEVNSPQGFSQHILLS